MASFIVKGNKHGKNRVLGEISHQIPSIHQQTSVLAIFYNACQFIANLP